jgi:pSer/pThr/pTyr-binding forkhead associated (FHA) protein
MSVWIFQSSDPEQSDLTFRLSPGTARTIGRAPRADFVVNRALVSRIHCRLIADDEQVEVVDLSSTNGTFVNGERVERARVSGGDRLRIGRVELAIRWDS